MSRYDQMLPILDLLVEGLMATNECIRNLRKPLRGIRNHCITLFGINDKIQQVFYEIPR